MKSRLLPLLLALALSPVAAAPAWPPVPPGIEYVQQRIGDVPWAIHVVKIDRKRADLRLVCSQGRRDTIGRRAVSAQAALWSAIQGRPLAAVNADFFIMAGAYAGDPSGLEISSGELVSAAGVAAFWIDPAGKPHAGPVRSLLHVTWPDGSETPFGLNEAGKEDAAVLYTPSIGASTHTKGGRELVLERDGDSPWVPVRPGQVLQARVREVREAGDTPLSADTLVLSLGPKLAVKLPPAGARLKLTLATDPDLSGVQTAVGGKPVLLSGGVEPDWGAGAQPRHPRTAVGWNDDTLYLIVVDGRQKGLSAGMTFHELAELARRLGCTDALNLDGGGSTTLWLGGTVMNSPSDGAERPVANALLVVQDGGAATPAGAPQPSAGR